MPPSALAISGGGSCNSRPLYLLLPAHSARCTFDEQTPHCNALVALRRTPSVTLMSTTTNAPPSSDDVDGARLLHACRAGDASAFAALYRTHVAAVYGYALGRVGPDSADDVVSEAFTAAWHAIDTYDPTLGSIRSWLYGIATNVLRRHRRAEIRWSESLSRLDPEQRTELDPTLPSPALLKGLLELSPTTRDLLLLVAVADMTTAQAAKVLRIHNGAARVRLHRARKHLQAALGSEGTDHA